jgi:hypothetical protein
MKKSDISVIVGLCDNTYCFVSTLAFLLTRRFTDDHHGDFSTLNPLYLIQCVMKFAK